MSEVDAGSGAGFLRERWEMRTWKASETEFLTAKGNRPMGRFYEVWLRLIAFAGESEAAADRRLGCLKWIVMVRWKESGRLVDEIGPSLLTSAATGGRLERRVAEGWGFCRVSG